MTLIRNIILFLLIPVSCFAIHPGILGTSSDGAATGYNYTGHANCMGAWYLNADAGTSETDRSGEGYTLAVSASDTIPTSANQPASYTGAARDFESGDEDFLYIADASAANLDINGADATITVCAWINPESLPGSGLNMAVVSKNAAAGPDRQYMLSIQEDTGSTYARFVKSHDGTNTTSVSGTTALSTGNWYHLCGVYDDSNVEIWVNGIREAYSASTTGIYDSDMKFMVGARDTDGTGSSLYFDGLIDEAIVFNAALTGTQINEIKNYGISGDRGGSD